MYQGKKVSAVVLAAGKGRRMGMEMNKQYLPVAGIPVLARTLAALEQNSWIDEILLVVNRDDIGYCEKELIEKYQITKVTAIVAGGKERQDSCWNGIQQLSPDTEYVLMQDGARPFVTDAMITEALQALEQYDACCVAVPVKDTVKIANKEGNIQETPDRSLLYAAQTPQGFRYDIATEIYQRAIQEGYQATDDSQLAEHYGYVSHLIAGNYENIKITTKEDLYMAETIVTARGY